MHRSRRIGEGQEFAELRPYAPGDRLRDLNWRATARHGKAFVNRHHPELSGEVVIAIDAFDDGSSGSAEALARAARAAWALAAIHLRASDRVGVVGLGGSVRWLPPAGGRRARYRLLETLLGIGGSDREATLWNADARPLARPALRARGRPHPAPRRPDVGALLAWRARGPPVAAVVVDTRDGSMRARLGCGGAGAPALVARAGSAPASADRMGIPVVTAGRGPIGPVIAALRRAGRGSARGQRR
jgi:uncharacterized protein (DUF58 family)